MSGVSSDWDAEKHHTGTGLQGPARDGTRECDDQHNRRADEQDRDWDAPHDDYQAD